MNCTNCNQEIKDEAKFKVGDIVFHKADDRKMLVLKVILHSTKEYCPPNVTRPAYTCRYYSGNSQDMYCEEQYSEFELKSAI